MEGVRRLRFSLRAKLGLVALVLLAPMVVALVVAGALSRLAMLGTVVLAPYRREAGLGLADSGGQ